MKILFILLQIKTLVQMESQQLLQELENVAARLGIAVRYEEGDFKGGLCRIKTEKVLIMNSKFSIEKKIATLASELSTLDLSTIYILPKLRDRIFSETSSAEKTV